MANGAFRLPTAVANGHIGLSAAAPLWPVRVDHHTWRLRGGSAAALLAKRTVLGAASLLRRVRLHARIWKKKEERGGRGGER